MCVLVRNALSELVFALCFALFLEYFSDKSRFRLINVPLWTGFAVYWFGRSVDRGFCWQQLLPVVRAPTCPRMSGWMQHELLSIPDIPQMRMSATCFGICESCGIIQWPDASFKY